LVDTDKEEDNSLIEDINKSVKIPKINILGTDVKLDVLSLLGLALGGAAALGTGYLLYDQYKNKTEIENVRKKQEEEYRLQRIDYEQRVREEQIRQQQQQLLPRKNVPQQEDEPEEEQEEEDNSLIDMNTYYKKPEPEKLSYEQMLARANGIYRPSSYNTGSTADIPVFNQPQPQQPQPDPNIIDTDRYMDNTNSQIQVLPSVAAQPKRKPRVEEPVQQQQEEGPTPDELYASLGNTNNNYY
jgi:hypothetical protein